jgi:hypothetical protein
MSDTFMYDRTLDSSQPINVAENKQVLLSQDSTSSYLNQIVFDSSSLTNSGRWVNWSEGYIQVPFAISCISTADCTAVINQFSFGLKSGFWSLIDSIQVDCNNSNVVSLQPLSNMHCHFKALTSWSQNDLAKYGQTCGFTKDSAGSYVFEAVGLGGDGFQNNIVQQRLTPAPFRGTTTTFTLDQYNDGLYQRLKNCTDVTALAGNTNSGALSMQSAAQAALVAKSCVLTDNGVGGIPNLWQKTYIATIRLKDLTDYFDKVPMARGVFYRITLNFNSANFTISSVLNTSLTLTSYTQTAGRSCPVIVSSSAVNNPNRAIPTGVLTFKSGIAAGGGSVFTPASITACQMYVPSYQLDPVFEQELLKTVPVKTIRYNDLYMYQQLNIATGASSTFQVTNGLANMRYIVIVPTISASTIGTPTGLAQYQNPFDSCPGTTAPLAALTNIQIQISGSNAWNSLIRWNFSNFNDELSQINAINNGQMVGLSSGLINSYDFDTAYRYYVCDVSRRLKSEDNVPKSVSINCTNATLRSLDLTVFVIYERKVGLNMLSGENI